MSKKKHRNCQTLLVRNQTIRRNATGAEQSASAFRSMKRIPGNNDCGWTRFYSDHVNPGLHHNVVYPGLLNVAPACRQARPLELECYFFYSLMTADCGLVTVDYCLPEGVALFIVQSQTPTLQCTPYWGNNVQKANFPGIRSWLSEPVLYRAGFFGCFHRYSGHSLHIR